MVIALTIAGSDSGAGAGIQADLKTFAACGVYGTSVITALTAQNTRGVAGVHVVPSDFVTAQIETVVSDLPPAAVKTGMLASAAVVEAVAAAIEALALPNVVVDPVMIAKSGDRLLSTDAVAAMRAELLPRALIVTPNAEEAAELAGMRVRTLDEAREGARRIHRLGPRHVIVKGGHLDTVDVIDLFFDGDTFVELPGERLASRHLHGTGCTFAAALAAALARGDSALEATRGARQFVDGAIRAGIRVGGGHGPLGHFWRWMESPERG